MLRRHFLSSFAALPGLGRFFQKYAEDVCTGCGAAVKFHEIHLNDITEVAYVQAHPCGCSLKLKDAVVSVPRRLNAPKSPQDLMHSMMEQVLEENPHFRKVELNRAST